jgi:hypothetical protein
VKNRDFWGRTVLEKHVPSAPSCASQDLRADALSERQDGAYAPFL